MTGRIYLLNENSELKPMDETLYDSEDLLQGLIEKHPDILAGEQINSDSPRRWLLITREMSVPGEEDGAGRWSLDHLFLDQDAIPTLIEVKRSTDTRIRREVVGQMLDYAANAVAYWPVEKIQAEFESRCESQNKRPDDAMEALLGAGYDADVFWQRVKTNLQAGRVRMVFLSDMIPAELRRIVEFLNGQMDPAEVIAIEVKQFVGNGMKTLVPRVIGQSEAARSKRTTSSTGKQWDESSFFECLQSKKGEREVTAARACLEWAKSRGLRVWWGKGSSYGSFFPIYDNRFGKNFLFAVWSYGRIELQFQHMTQPPFDDQSKRWELAQRLTSACDVTIAKESLSKRPSFDLDALFSSESLTGFLSTFDWALSEIKNREKSSQ